MALSEQGQFNEAGPLALRRLATPHLVRLLGEWRSSGAAYPALAAALRALIVEGRVPPQTRLPSERALAAALGVSRNTATAALDVLRTEGYLASRRGTGSWVTLPAVDEDRPDEPPPWGGRGAGSARDELPRRGWRGPGHAPNEPSRRGWRGAGDARGDVIDLTVANLPAPAGLAALATAAAAELPRELGGHGYEPFGLPSLRAAVAAHLSARGLPTEPAQVLITQGALHAFDLALRTLVRPGDRVLVETPTYPAALDAIRAHGCVPVGVPVDARGWDMDFLASALHDARPRLGYLIPDFQNPTGFRAPAPARRAVARAARAAGVPLVSDESLAALWLDDSSPAPPSAARGDHGTGVLAVGSLSKSVWGGLRTGWVRADRELVRRMAFARGSQDVGGPVLDQLLAVEVFGGLEALLPGRRDLLRERRDALLGALAAERPAWGAARPAGGMSLWVELPEGTPAAALSARALEHGVRVAPGSRFGADGGFDRRVRLPFTQPPERLAEAVRRLAAAEQSLAGRPPAVEPPARWVA